MTGDDRSRESGPGTEVYAMAANATRAAKPIRKARSSAYVDVGSSFILILLLIAVLLVVVSVAAVAACCCLDGAAAAAAATAAARSDEPNAIIRCCSRSCTPTSVAIQDLRVPL